VKRVHWVAHACTDVGASCDGQQMTSGRKRKECGSRTCFAQTHSPACVCHIVLMHSTEHFTTTKWTNSSPLSSRRSMLPLPCP
jgi:hypothetical protein